MNTSQINYFLTASEYLNFTEAAKKLYISQPALSKQLQSIENELELKLFSRDGKKVHLTPAGVVLYEELKGFNKEYNAIIDNAKKANEGSVGILRIGILEGQLVGDTFIRAYQKFIEEYPDITVKLSRGSFSVLKEQLDRGKIDLAVSLGFHIKNDTDFSNITIMKNQAFLVASKKYLPRSIHIKSWKDLEGETFIVIDPKDSYTASQMLINECQRLGFNPKVDFAPSLESAMLWTEAGLGICVVDESNYLTLNPNIQILISDEFLQTETVLAWNQKIANPITFNFIEMFSE